MLKNLSLFFFLIAIIPHPIIGMDSHLQDQKVVTSYINISLTPDQQKEKDAALIEQLWKKHESWHRKKYSSK